MDQKIFQIQSAKIQAVDEILHRSLRAASVRSYHPFLKINSTNPIGYVSKGLSLQKVVIPAVDKAFVRTPRNTTSQR